MSVISSCFLQMQFNHYVCLCQCSYVVASQLVLSKIYSWRIGLFEKKNQMGVEDKGFPGVLGVEFSAPWTRVSKTKMAT